MQNPEASLELMNGLQGVLLPNFGRIFAGGDSAQVIRILWEQFEQLNQHIRFWVHEQWKNNVSSLKHTINELKMVKNSLQKYLDISYQVLKAAPIGVVYLDQSLRIQKWNIAATKMSGYSGGEVLSIPFTDLLDGSSSDKFNRVIHFMKRKHASLKVNIQHKNGASRQMILDIRQFQINPLDEIIYLVYIQDLDLRQQNKRNTQRMTQVATLSRLASTIMHDIRNPLNSIGLNAEVLSNLVFDYENKVERSQIASLVEKIQNEIRQAVGNLNFYLSLESLTELKMEEFNIITNLLQLANEFMVYSAQFGVLLEVQAGREKELYVKGDWRQLRRAFENLLTNAIEASQKEGTVTVTCKKSGEAVLIKIRDYGNGIPKKIRGRIFEPFFTTKHNGTGLGLYICREIILSHGGKIRLISKENWGSEFMVKLPVLSK
ncbi:MAG: hypothetical protein Kow0037_23910 [Calditrichia bacterium]